MSGRVSCSFSSAFLEQKVLKKLKTNAHVRFIKIW